MVALFSFGRLGATPEALGLLDRWGEVLTEDARNDFSVRQRSPDPQQLSDWERQREGLSSPMPTVPEEH